MDVLPEHPELRVVLKPHQTALLDSIHLRAREQVIRVAETLPNVPPTPSPLQTPTLFTFPRYRSPSLHRANTSSPSLTPPILRRDTEEKESRAHVQLRSDLFADSEGGGFMAPAEALLQEKKSGRGQKKSSSFNG